MSLDSVTDVWPGSPLVAIFRIEAPDEATANRAACDEAKALGYRVKTRGGTAQAEPGVWVVELRVRPAVPA